MKTRQPMLDTWVPMAPRRCLTASGTVEVCLDIGGVWLNQAVGPLKEMRRGRNLVEKMASGRILRVALRYSGR